MGMLWGHCQTERAARRFPILLPHQVRFLPSRVGALCTTSQPHQEGQWALLVLDFKAFYFSSIGAGTSTKHQQPELQAPSRQCFVYFLPLFYIHSAPITAVVSSPSCYNEHANFKQSIVTFLTASTKAIQKDKREPSHLGHGKNSIFQRKISTNYQGSQFSASGFTY